MNRDSNCTMTAVELDWPRYMEQRFRERPRLLRQSASHGLCCIFRVQRVRERPQGIRTPDRVHRPVPSREGAGRDAGTAQTPIVCRSASSEPLVRRTGGSLFPSHGIGGDKNKGMLLGGSGLRKLEFDRNDGSRRMFRGRDVPGHGIPSSCRSRRSLVLHAWVFSFLTLDLLLIENQIPFFVLETVFKLSRAPTEAHYSLNKLALEFFNYSLHRSQHELERHYHDPNVTHLLDLFRLSLVGHLELEDPGDVDEEFQQLIPSAKQLLLAGIKLKPRKSDRFIDVGFERGVLQIPPLTLDAFTRSLFLNCIAFEQCSCYCSKHITTYAVLMRCVVTTAADAALLSERNIITNFLGSDEDVARYFNNLARGVSFDISTSYLAEVFREVTRYHQNRWHVRWSGIKREYFGSAWSFISAAAAFVLLALTVVQAFYAVYAYYRPSK